MIQLDKLDGVVYYASNRRLQDYPVTGAAGLARVQDKHFWFTSRNQWIELFVRKTIPDKYTTFLGLGCGTGYVLKTFEKMNIDAVGVDMHDGGLKIGSRYLKTPLVCADIDSLQFDSQFQVVGLFDVIEHLNDDVEALKKAVSFVSPQGYILVSVPAFQSLWSQFDMNAGHKRRYTISHLRRVMEKAQLRPVRMSYIFSFAFPLVAIQRLYISRTKEGSDGGYLKPPHILINKMLSVLSNVELYYYKSSRHSVVPFGTSIIALARTVR